MAPSLRNRLVCFYCGCRSEQRAHNFIRQWKCKKCEAVNHLDENGEITDPPVSESVSAVQYAHSIPRAASPTLLASTDGTLFCPTCLQNQHLLTQLLASYLPPSADASDADYESQYPKYRARLEEQYPQVCEECVPRVRERIRATGYAAKTDHLRRMMERTREIKAQKRWESWAWADVVVLAGACGWWASLAGQVLWNIMGAMALVDSEDGLRTEEIHVALPKCVLNGLQYGAVPLECEASTSPIAGLALILGVVSMWWNSRLSEKVRGSRPHLVGLKEYYKLQVLVLMARTGAWLFLQRGGIGSEALRAAHLFMLVFLAIFTIMSMRIVKVDHTPKVSWQESPETLSRLQPPPEVRTSHNFSGNPTENQSSHFNRQSAAYVQPFPLNNLAPINQQPHPPPYQPPTPPPEEEPETMDWTPTRSSFQPASVHSISRKVETSSEASPFYGRLPAAPQSQAQRLRNPQNQPNFRKTAFDKQRNFFDSMTQRLSPKRLTQDEGSPDHARHDSFELAPPKFFPRGDFRTDTGLENMFDSAFSLRDEPLEVRAAREHEQHLARLDHPSPTVGAWGRITGIALLGTASLVWKAAITRPQFALHLRLGALGVIAVIAGRALLEALGTTKPFWSLSDIFLFAAELAASILLGSAISSVDSMPDTYDTMGMVLLGGMMVQEIWLFISAQKDRAPLSPAPDPIAPSSPPSHLKSETMTMPDPAAQAPKQRVPPMIEPRMTRSRSKRESFIPSTSLSGLSLTSGDSDCGLPSTVTTTTTASSTPTAFYNDRRFPVSTRGRAPAASGRNRTQPGLDLGLGVGAFGLGRR